MTRKYIRYVSPWTGEIKWYPYIERGIPQRPSPEWMREQEVNLDERMKKGTGHPGLAKIVVCVLMSAFALWILLLSAGYASCGSQDHRKPSENSQSNQEYPIEFYENGR